MVGSSKRHEYLVWGRIGCLPLNQTWLYCVCARPCSLIGWRDGAVWLLLCLQKRQDLLVHSNDTLLLFTLMRLNLLVGKPAHGLSTPGFLFSFCRHRKPFTACDRTIIYLRPNYLMCYFQFNYTIVTRWTISLVSSKGRCVGGQCWF